MSSRELGEPISSSPVIRIVTPPSPARPIPQRRGGVQSHHHPGLHVEAARPAQHIAVHCERMSDQRAERPHGVVVPEQQDPRRSTAEPPAQVRPAVEDDPLGRDAEAPRTDRRHDVGAAGHGRQVGRGRLAGRRAPRCRRASPATMPASGRHPSAHLGRRPHAEVQVPLAGRQRVERDRRPGLCVRLADGEQVLGRPATIGYSWTGSGTSSASGPVIVVRSTGPSSPRGPPCARSARSYVPTCAATSTDDRFGRRRQRPRHGDAGELGEDLAVQVLVQVAGVAAVGEHRDGEARVGQQPQERRLPDRVAVVADEPVPVPAEADPAQPHESPSEYLSGRSACVLGHRRGARLAEQPAAVRREAAGEVQPGEAEHVGGGRVDQPGGPDRARQPPDRRDRRFGRPGRRRVRRRRGAAAPPRAGCSCGCSPSGANSRSRIAASQVSPVSFSMTRPSTREAGVAVGPGRAERVVLRLLTQQRRRTSRGSRRRGRCR